MEERSERSVMGLGVLKGKIQLPAAVLQVTSCLQNLFARLCAIFPLDNGAIVHELR